MSGRDCVDYLQDITDSIDDIADFITGISLEEFNQDKRFFSEKCGWRENITGQHFGVRAQKLPLMFATINIIAA